MGDSLASGERDYKVFAADIENSSEVFYSGGRPQGKPKKGGPKTKEERDEQRQRDQQKHKAFLSGVIKGKGKQQKGNKGGAGGGSWTEHQHKGTHKKGGGKNWRSHPYSNSGGSSKGKGGKGKGKPGGKGKGDTRILGSCWNCGKQGHKSENCRFSVEKGRTIKKSNAYSAQAEAPTKKKKKKKPNRKSQEGSDEEQES